MIRYTFSEIRQNKEEMTIKYISKLKRQDVHIP